ncbi:MAG TPA: DUF2069 domain-containing protein [Gammaproteobacteria bacterium]|nr:DUF2069 domain-containing protein [Gammaproteobacteria bacterium]
MRLHFTGRNLARAAFLALVLWLGLWLGVLANAPANVRMAWAALSLLPLAILAPFLFRGVKAGYGWAGFVSLGYFAQGIAVTLGSRSVYGAVEIFLSILLFFSASAALRELQRLNAPR